MVFLQYILSSSLFLMMMMMMNTLVFAAGPSTGLSLKLIHRDSLYPRNLTKLERMERALQRWRRREQRIIWHQMKQVSSRNNSTTTTTTDTNNNSKSDIKTIRPEVKPYDESVYMVELGIGSFASMGGSPSYYNFYFDTGSDLLWLQCDANRTGGTKKGTEYFVQDAKKYNLGETSLTYNPLPYHNPNHICRKYFDVPPEGQGQDYCGYEVIYMDGGSTEGVLATEKLTVKTDNGGTEEIEDFVMGCGYRQHEPFFGKEEGEHPIAGILGLGGGEESFIRQLGVRVDNKFEFCLKPAYEEDVHHDAHTFLRFGSDTKIASRGRGVQSTATVIIRAETLYHVIMKGISIQGRPVLYPEGSDVFEAQQGGTGTGGVVFDAGSDFTTVSPQVYGPFRDQLVTWFNTTHGIRRRSPKGKLSEYDLCFKGPVGFDEFPIITFRFNGGDFEMESDIVFASEGPMFCLTILLSRLRYPLSLMLGAIHQANHRILHDVGLRTVSWINEDCAIDP